MGAPPGGSVKGVAFRTVMALLAKHQSPAVAEAALEAMPKDLRDALRYGTIIAAGWYPVAWYRSMWGAILAATGEGEPLVRTFGRAAVDYDTSTLYKAIFRLLTPQTLVSIGLRHFAQIYGKGHVEVSDSKAKSISIHWSGCEGFDRAMWVEILGSCERLAELAGGVAAHASVHSGGGDGDESCKAIVRWR